VPDHRIRLRGGWESIDLRAPARPPTRVTLPVRWGATEASMVQLTRRFGRPPFDPRGESLWLSLGHVAGLRTARLNGHPLATEGLADGTLEVLLEPAERNELVLDVEVTPDQGEGPQWGDIALVIRPLDSAPAADRMIPARDSIAR
jgi:hypothetical protein